MNFKNKTYS